MNKRNTALFLSICAILSAFSIVLGKYLAINLGPNFRLSFENLPLFIAALYLGPTTASIVGVAADLLGCLLVGYAINPIITLGALSIGLISGLIGKVFRRRTPLRLLLSIFPAHLFGSVLIKTTGLYLFYGSPFLPTAGWRFVIYLCTGLLEFLTLYFLSKNRAFERQMKRFTNNKEI